MPVQVKICGITRPEDASVAIAAGASMLGFMFYQASPRHITQATAAAILANLPSAVVKVGVFVNPTETEVRTAIERCGLTALQFHGEESPEFCDAFSGVTVIKAFRIRDAKSLDELPRYRTGAWLLDAYVAGQRGGTGTTFNWELAIQAKSLGRPVILAGGLSPENVAEAVRRVRPYGVDVSGGVESSPGIKDPDKIKRFIEAATGA